MDFEAILNEAEGLKKKLMGLKDQIDRLLDIEFKYPICEKINLASDGIKLDGEAVEGSELTLDALLKAAGDKQSEKVLCQLCC